MQGTNLGEFEEIVLLSVAILADDAYGNSIKNESGNDSAGIQALGALHASCNDSKKKDISDRKREKQRPERGGRRNDIIL